MLLKSALSEKTASAKFPHKRPHAKTTIDVQFRQKMKKKDVDKAKTSHDLTITVKLLTVNRAHRLRKILYTKSKFHSFL